MEKRPSRATQCGPPRRQMRTNAASRVSSRSWQPPNPTTCSYLVLRLADDSFVHVSFHNHGEDDVNPIASTAAFAHFQDGRADAPRGRCRPTDRRTGRVPTSPQSTELPADNPIVRTLVLGLALLVAISARAD